MTYAEAMRRFASDKPDLRIPLELVDVADLVRDCEFKVFAGPAADPEGSRRGAARTCRRRAEPQADRRLHGLSSPAMARVASPTSRSTTRAAGRDGLQSPILKFLSDEAVAGLMQRTGAANGDLIFFGADKAKVVNDAIGALRIKVGQDLGLVEQGWRPLWVTDFPMFEWDADARRWMAMHHPFTAPLNPDAQTLAANPGAAIAQAYDMVLNGSEIGGGSVRIHRQEMQSTVFGLLGIAHEEAAASSASCSRRCATARRRTAASRSGSTGW
jgi:aspartyl-tRNA synthetase